MKSKNMAQVKNAEDDSAAADLELPFEQKALEIILDEVRVGCRESLNILSGWHFCCELSSCVCPHLCFDWLLSIIQPLCSQLAIDLDKRVSAVELTIQAIADRLANTVSQRLLILLLDYPFKWCHFSQVQIFLLICCSSMIHACICCSSMIHACADGKSLPLSGLCIPQVRNESLELMRGVRSKVAGLVMATSSVSTSKLKRQRYS